LAVNYLPTNNSTHAPTHGLTNFFQLFSVQEDAAGLQLHRRSPTQAAARHLLNQTDPPDRSAQHGELEHYQDSLIDSLQSPYLWYQYVHFIFWHDQIRK
jgi:hypothetical protein